MPRRLLLIAIPLLILWLGTTFLRTPSLERAEAPKPPSEEPAGVTERTLPESPLPGDILLAGYASPDTPPIEDLKKLHNVLSGYFSVVKDLTRHPIGGNEDLTACLLGENLNQQAFIRSEHPIVSEDQRLIDRWGNPFSIHPEAARELTIRSAGPDQKMFTEDDLVLLPTGLSP